MSFQCDVEKMGKGSFRYSLFYKTKVPNQIKSWPKRKKKMNQKRSIKETSQIQRLDICLMLNKFYSTYTCHVLVQ